MVFFIVGLLIGAGLGAGIMMALGGDDEGVPIDTLVVATISGNPESLDPAVDYETVGGEIIQNVYETLMFYDGEKADVLYRSFAQVPTMKRSDH